MPVVGLGCVMLTVHAPAAVTSRAYFPGGDEAAREVPEAGCRAQSGVRATPAKLLSSPGGYVAAHQARVATPSVLKCFASRVTT